MKHLTNNRFITGIIIIIIITSGIIYGVEYYDEYRNKQKAFTDSFTSVNMHLSNNAAVLISEIILPEKELIMNSAQKLQNMNLSDNQKIQEFISERSAGFTTIGGFYFGRNDGTHFTNSGRKLPPEYDPRKRLWYILAADRGEFIITDSYIDSLTGKTCITLAAPVYQNHRLMGVVALDIFVDKFHKLFEYISANSSAHYYVTDYYGNIIINDGIGTIELNLAKELSKLSDNINFSSLLKKQDWKSILSSNNGTININYSKNEKLLGYYWTMPQEGWKVIAVTDPKIYSSGIENMKTMFYIYGVIGISFLLFIILIIISINIYIEKVKMKYILTHDVLTGLPNRQFLEIFFKGEAAKSNEAIEYSLLLIDIDNFKFINDTYGHNIGDEVLKSIAHMLKDIVPEDGLLIRSGGDEFAVLLTNITIESAKYFTERLQSSICNSPFRILNNSLYISISTGYTVISNATDITKFFSLANAALKKAKDEGKNKAVCLLPQDINTNINDPEKVSELILLIKNALMENRFVLFLQPIIETDSKKIKHYEALIRLKGKDNSIITPAIFIPIAEQFGLISEIDRFVFKEVLKIISTVHDTTIFINISGLSLTNNALLEYFEKSIIDSGIDSSHLNLGLEITETAATKNFIEAQKWMEKFKKLGCKIALDDFGVGYTSFTYIRSLPIDYIKIDGSFVHNIDKDSSHKAIVQTINTLAVSLGKDTIAEFVENEAVFKILKEMGVKYGQGYHLGKPESLGEKLKLLS